MDDQDRIKTIQYIKRTKHVTLLYFLFCCISLALFAAHEYQQVTYGYFNRNLFSVAMLTVYLWIVNPMVLIVSAIGFGNYVKESKDLQKRQQIGKKWIAFILWSAGSVIAWMVSGMIFVLLTGGV